MGRYRQRHLSWPAVLGHSEGGEDPDHEGARKGAPLLTDRDPSGMSPVRR